MSFHKVKCLVKFLVLVECSDELTEADKIEEITDLVNSDLELGNIDVTYESITIEKLDGVDPNLESLPRANKYMLES